MSLGFKRLKYKNTEDCGITSSLNAWHLPDYMASHPGKRYINGVGLKLICTVGVCSNVSAAYR